MHPKAQCFLLTSDQLVWPFIKKINIFNVPKIEAFIINKVFSSYIQYMPTLLNKRICDELWSFLRNVLDAHSWMHGVSPQCLSRIFILNFVNHHFIMLFTLTRNVSPKPHAWPKAQNAHLHSLCKVKCDWGVLKIRSITWRWSSLAQHFGKMGLKACW
jgi:hypothetical protein